MLFRSIPFGLTAQEFHGWIYHGGGLELWQEVYAEHGLVPFLAGNSGPQMGGWFNKEVKTIEDLVGLKMRIPGPGGEILRRAGGTPTNIPGAELFTALQTGTIDAAEWVGPYNDLAFGLFRAAEYYYYPGWQETGSGLECMINKEKWNALPADLQAIVRVACQAVTTQMLSEFTYNNGVALKSLVENHDVQLRRFPNDVLNHLSGIADELLLEWADQNELMRRIYDSYKSYEQTVKPWTRISDEVLMDMRRS